MNPVLRNPVFLVVAVSVSLVLKNWLHISWSEALINDRIFTVYCTFIPAGDLLNWLVCVAFFDGGGLLLAPALSSSRVSTWGYRLEPAIR